ncbi:MAG TPA: SAM-dependent methyltransferase, partial [Candidatus Pelethenecus sp.]|nr:SAM-dependent methyltransferase [Candidatus Pelethenecus sp.]
MSILFPENIIKGSLSISTEECDYVKAKLQRIKIKQEDMIQVSFFTKQQVYHQNIKLEEVSSFLNQQFNVNFKSLELFTEDFIYYYKITSKGKLLTNRKKQQNEFLVLEHNKNKQYLLTEGMIIPPMIDLGVMTLDGKVVKDKWDKFKQ